MTPSERDTLRAELEAEMCRHHERDAKTIVRVREKIATIKAMPADSWEDRQTIDRIVWIIENALEETP